MLVAWGSADAAAVAADAAFVSPRAPMEAILIAVARHLGAANLQQVDDFLD
jgi:hypothetical protein